MKLLIDDLAVEVTRRCNMSCEHCLRGEPQNKDLDTKRLERFLSDVTSINTITFTGGEPTLNVPAIRKILSKCKELKIPVYSFYIATNGKKITNSFLIAMIEWYSYCLTCGGEPEISGLALSSDRFHQKIPALNREKLAAFTFFRPEDKQTDWNKIPLLNLGRAKQIENYPTRKNYIYPPTVKIHDDEIWVTDGLLTFTADGDLLSDCNYEYKSTDDIKIGTWDTAVKSLSSLA